jgi:osmotically-inducible protein OsmY
MRLLLFGVAIGVLAYALRKPSRGQPVVADDVLITRVRLALDQAMAHAGSVDIQCHGGVITLSGPAGKPEVRGVLRAVRAIPGVRQVVSRLTPHAVAA